MLLHNFYLINFKKKCLPCFKMMWLPLVVILCAATANVLRGMWAGQGRCLGRISGVLALTSPPFALHHFAGQLTSGPQCSPL